VLINLEHVWDSMFGIALRNIVFKAKKNKKYSIFKLFQKMRFGMKVFLSNKPT
jgi:hypothetical protein